MIRYPDNETFLDISLFLKKRYVILGFSYKESKFVPWVREHPVYTYILILKYVYIYKHSMKKPYRGTQSIIAQKKNWYKLDIFNKWEYESLQEMKLIIYNKTVVIIDSVYYRGMLTLTVYIIEVC